MVNNFRTYLKDLSECVTKKGNQAIVLTKLPSAYRKYPRIEKPNSSKRPVTLLNVVDVVD